MGAEVLQKEQSVEGLAGGALQGGLVLPQALGHGDLGEGVEDRQPNRVEEEQEGGEEEQEGGED